MKTKIMVIVGLSLACSLSLSTRAYAQGDAYVSRFVIWRPSPLPSCERTMPVDSCLNWGALHDGLRVV